MKIRDWYDDEDEDFDAFEKVEKIPHRHRKEDIQDRLRGKKLNKSPKKPRPDKESQ